MKTKVRSLTPNSLLWRERKIPRYFTRPGGIGELTLEMNYGWGLKDPEKDQIFQNLFLNQKKRELM